MAVGSTVATSDKHPLDQVLPFGQMFIYGLQHVLSMYAGVVAVPLIVGTAFKLSGPEITYLVSAGLFISGLATLLQTLDSGSSALGSRLCRAHRSLRCRRSWLSASPRAAAWRVCARSSARCWSPACSPC